MSWEEFNDRWNDFYPKDKSAERISMRHGVAASGVDVFLISLHAENGETAAWISITQDTLTMLARECGHPEETPPSSCKSRTPAS